MKKNVSILTVGNEILTGFILNTNSQWIGKELDLLGFNVSGSYSVRDEKKSIIEILDYSLSNSDIVIITGGLGPTNDDITKNTLCEYFKSNLVLNNDVLDNISSMFQKRGYELTKLNKNQALVPANCRVLQNYLGTAPGMCFELNNKIIISLPGVPFEMIELMNNSVMPFLTERFSEENVTYKVISTQGIGESFLADKIKNWEDNLPEGFLLAYLPSVSIVKLRLSYFYKSSEDKIEVENLINIKVEELKQLIPEYIFSENNESLSQVLGKLLIENCKTIATAESCTGGYIAHQITLNEGCSAYFKGSVVAYSNEIKENILNVNSQIISTNGAVSAETVELMIKGVINKFNVDYAIAISGIAGPGGGTEEKPVGTVYIGVGNKQKSLVKRFTFGADRERNIQRSAMFALKMMIDFIKS
ncbi:MAG: competence/damage-inducible protein A [Bacteroidota bacterium]